MVSVYRKYLGFTTLLYVQTKGAQAARSHFLLWTAEKKERVSRVESVHPHHHPHLTQSRTLFAAKAACAESHSGLKSDFMLAKEILSEMAIFHFESNLKFFGFS